MSPNQKHPALLALQLAEETPALDGDSEAMDEALAEMDAGETATSEDLLQVLDRKKPNQ